MSFWKNVSVLVTGAHGFTGSHLCRELCRGGARVKAFVKKGSSTDLLEDLRQQITVVHGDVTDFDSLIKALDQVEYVFNPAAVVAVMDARQNPQRSFLVNGIGSFNVAYASMKAGVKKMLHVSTCHVYGNLPEHELPTKENALPLPGDLYAVSKYAAEIYLKPLMNEGFPVVISRAFGKYGPGQGSQYLIPRIITQLLQGQIPKLGSPKPTRDYSYIVDIVRGYMSILEKGKAGEVYHLSSEKETTVGQMYERIAKGLGMSGVKPVWNDEVRPQDILRQWGDSQKSRNEFGWKPQVGLDEGLSKTIDWWKDQFFKGER